MELPPILDLAPVAVGVAGVVLLAVYFQGLFASARRLNMALKLTLLNISEAARIHDGEETALDSVPRMAAVFSGHPALTQTWTEFEKSFIQGRNAASAAECFSPGNLVSAGFTADNLRRTLRMIAAVAAAGFALGLIGYGFRVPAHEGSESGLRNLLIAAAGVFALAALGRGMKTCAAPRVAEAAAQLTQCLDALYCPEEVEDAATPRLAAPPVHHAEHAAPAYSGQAAVPREENMVTSSSAYAHSTHQTAVFPEPEAPRAVAGTGQRPISDHALSAISDHAPGTMSDQALRVIAAEIGQQIGRQIGQEIARTLAQSLEGGSRAAARSAEPVSNAFAQKMEDILGGVAATMHDLKANAEYVSGLTRTSAEKLEQSSRTILVAAEKFGETGAIINSQMSQTQNLSRHMMESSAALNSTTQSLVSTAQSLGSTTQALGQVVADYGQARDSLAALVASLESLVRDAESRTQLSQSFVGDLQKVAVSLNQTQAQTDQYLHQVSGVLAAGFASFGNAVQDNLQQSSAAFHDSLSGSVEVVSGQIRSLTEALDDMLARMHRTS
jgi:hypothetical protein